MDGVANPYPDYANFLDLIDVADIDVLRDDPSMSLLVDAYDKAREVNERYN